MALQALHLVLRQINDLAAPEPSRSSVAINSLCEKVDRLIALTSIFAVELRAAGGDPLDARLDQFRREVEQLGRAREAVRQQLAGLGEDQLYVPDFGVPSGSVRRVFVNDGDGLSLELHNGVPNAARDMLLRLEDVWGVVWDVPTAYRDLDGFLSARPAADVSLAIEVWRGALRTYVAVDERHHLFGTYLIERCSQAVGGQSAPTGEGDLFRHLGHDFRRYAQVVLDTAEHLAEAVTVLHTPAHTAAEQSTAGFGPPQKFYSPQDPRPAKFGCGPLAGPPSYLARIICPEFGATNDYRALYKLGLQGCVWIVRYDTKRLEVYFPEGRPFTECDRAYRESVNTQQRARSRRN